MPRSTGDHAQSVWIPCVLLCLALIFRAGLTLPLSGSLANDPDGYRALASSLQEHGTLALPNGAPHPTAFRPPLYPLLLAAVDRENESYLPVFCLHVLLGVGTVWAVFRLGQLWGLPRGGSLLAAGLVAADPILLNQSVQVMTETLAAFLAALALVALTRCAREGSFRWAILAGCLFGLCVLCRPTFLIWLIGVAALLPFATLGSRRRATGIAIAFLAAAALVISPWAIRNQRIFGRPIVTTTHGGYTLLLANNPSFYEYLRSGAWGTVWDATEFNRDWNTETDQLATQADRQVAGTEELAVDARAYDLALENIHREPTMFAYACVVRVGRLWGILPHQLDPQESTARRLARYAIAIWYAAELLLAVYGAWSLGKNFLRSPWIWGALLLLSFTAVHTLYWSDLRMRAPLASVIALLAARGIVSIGRWQHGAMPLQEPT